MKTGEQDRSYPLIKTMLFIPSLRPKLVQRTHFIEKLKRTADGKLTFISAPAGFRKTTLLSELVFDSEITISVTYPCADRKEMEETNSCKIEESLEGLEGVNRLHYVTNCHKKPIDLNQLIE